MGNLFLVLLALPVAMAGVIYPFRPFRTRGRALATIFGCVNYMVIFTADGPPPDMAREIEARPRGRIVNFEALATEAQPGLAAGLGAARDTAEVIVPEASAQEPATAST